jgi:putative transposase
MISLLVDDPKTLGHRTRLCQMLGLSKATIYRKARQEAHAKEVDTDLRDRIQQISLENSKNGYRRITKQLRRDGVIVNHKKVLSLMREDNLLCLRKKQFVATTDSSHGLAVYPNLARRLCVCTPNQLWVADITYIRLKYRFVYLAVILDAFSRKCIGWAISNHLHSTLTVEALKMALAQRPAPQFHHSDRGVQYASSEYVSLLVEHQVQISMSRKGNPYDNAFAESFMKTLKYEEVYASDYETMEDVMQSLPIFLEQYYNNRRLHSAINYLPPTEFEAIFTEKTRHSPKLSVSV